MPPNEKQKKVLESLEDLKRALEGFVAHLENHTVAMAQAHVTAEGHHRMHAEHHRQAVENARKHREAQAAQAGTDNGEAE